MKIDTIIEKCRDIFVTKEYFDVKITPLERVIYGFISVTLLTVMASVLSLVIVRAK